MRILILTSKNHMYVNYVMNKLILFGVFKKYGLKILEQDLVLYNKNNFHGFLTYIKKSGFYYVFMQVLKQYCFNFFKFVNMNNPNSFYYPYYKRLNLKLEKCPSLKSNQAYEMINSYSPDLILSLFSKDIIPEKIIELSKLGCVNTHPSMLPDYRGVSPTFWCLANNEKKSGVTLHYIDKNIDTGKIIMQEEILIKNYKTEHKLYLDSCDIVIRFIIDFLDNRNLNLKDNIIKGGSYYSLPTKNAVKSFRKKGYKLFTFNELFSMR